jgi:hypothetical protein
MRKLMATVTTAAMLVAWSGIARADDDAEKEVTKQTTRQVSGAIIGRVGTLEAGPENQMFSVWSTSSYNSLTVKSTGPSANIAGVNPGSTFSVPDSHVNLFQEIVGFDARFNQVIAGVSTALSYTNSSQGGVTSSSPFGSITTGSNTSNGYSWTLSPYVAYVLNQNIFLAGVVGYTYGQDWAKSGGTSTPAINFGGFTMPAMTFPGIKSNLHQSTLFTDVSVNGIYPVANTGLTISGRVGWRYYYSWSESNVSGLPGNAGSGSTGNIGSFNAGANTIYTAVEGRYTFNNLQPYVRAQYEYSIPTCGSGCRDTNNVLLGAGMDVLINPSWTVGGDFVAQLADPNVTNWQIALNIRYKF